MAQMKKTKDPAKKPLINNDKMPSKEPSKLGLKFSELHTVECHCDGCHSKSKKHERRPCVTCMGCGDPIDRDHTGITCEQGCAICPECSQHFVNVVFENPAKSIPLRCMMCRSPIVALSFARQLTSKQRRAYRLYHMQFDPHLDNSGDKVAACPFCLHWEMNTDKGRILYWCRHKGCGRVSCANCKREIRMKNSETKEIYTRDMRYHFECVLLAPARKLWDTALNEGYKMACPHCGLAGMKDNACTHMVCAKCQTEWCYLCGLALNELDLDPKLSNHGKKIHMYAHNVGWQTNEKRCPMYLNEIHSVDPRWPEGESESLTFFHGLRTKKKLREALAQMSAKDYLAMAKKYRIDKNTGYSMRDVVKQDLTVIKRLS